MARLYFDEIFSKLFFNRDNDSIIYFLFEPAKIIIQPNADWTIICGYAVKSRRFFTKSKTFLSSAKRI